MVLVTKNVQTGDLGEPRSEHGWLQRELRGSLRELRGLLEELGTSERDGRALEVADGASEAAGKASKAGGKASGREGQWLQKKTERSVSPCGGSMGHRPLRATA